MARNWIPSGRVEQFCVVLLLIGLAKKVSPSKRLREYLGGEVDLRLARILDQVR